jgi:hypothetical protein
MTNQGLTDSLVSGYEVVLLMGAGQLCRTKNPKEARQLKINKCSLVWVSVFLADPEGKRHPFPGDPLFA